MPQRRHWRKRKEVEPDGNSRRERDVQSVTTAVQSIASFPFSDQKESKLGPHYTQNPPILQTFHLTTRWHTKICVKFCSKYFWPQFYENVNGSLKTLADQTQLILHILAPGYSGYFQGNRIAHICFSR